MADDFGLTADRINDRIEQIDGRRRRIQLATTVIGDGNGFDTTIDGNAGILNRLDALDHHRAFPFLTEPIDVVPGEPCVELPIHILRKRDCVGAVSDSLSGDIGEQNWFRSEKAPRPVRVNDGGLWRADQKRWQQSEVGVGWVAARAIGTGMC